MKTLQINFDLESEPPTKKQIEAEKQRLEQKIKKIKALNAAAFLFVIFFILFVFRSSVNFSSFWGSPLQIGLLTVFTLIALVCGFFVSDSVTRIKTYTEQGMDVLESMSKDQAQDVLNVCESSPICMEYATKVSMQDRPLTVKEAEKILDWPKKQKREAERQEEEKKKAAAFHRLRNLG